MKYKVPFFAVAGTLLFASALWIAWKPDQRFPRTARVGVDQSPPFYEIQPDGSVKGLAVDVLNEAANRQGIRLVWTPLKDIPLDTALSKGIVDIWPLVAPSSERRKSFFLSEPWLESDYVLVSLKSHPIRDNVEAVGQTIAYARLKTTAGIARDFLSSSRFLVKLYRSEAVQAVCSHEAAAALVESRVLDALLLDRPPGCEAAAFTISSLHEATVSLSLMSTKPYVGTARALRSEISRLAGDGYLSAKLDEWTPFSAEGTRSIWAAKAAEIRTRIYKVAFALILAVAMALIYMARRMSLARKSAERSEAARMAGEQRWQLALTAAGDALWDWDLLSDSIFRSPRWKTMLGYQDDEIGAAFDAWKALVHPEDFPGVSAALDGHLKREIACYSAEYRLRHKQGTWIWILDRGQAVWDEEGRPTRMTGSHSEITKRKAAEEALELIASTDPLTGLRNRREFDRILAELVEAERPQAGALSLCVCDLDWFKQVNDNYGHSMGDQVLAAFGRLLQESLRQTDIAARVGGDEFVVLFPGTKEGDAHQIMDRICNELRKTSFSTERGAEFRVSCSFGIAQLSGDCPGPAQLMEAADRRLYVWKNARRPKLVAIK